MKKLLLLTLILPTAVIPMDTNFFKNDYRVLQKRFFGTGEITLKKYNDFKPRGLALYNTNTCFIHQLSLNPKEQHKGLGSWLLKKSLNDMKKHGCQTVTVCSLFEAVGFYAKHGFETDHEALKYCNERYDTKRIPNPLSAMKKTL
ncbi:MAG: GNAT family N-acetyltransferase [Candidatus Babeliales bacterium]